MAEDARLGPRSPAWMASATGRERYAAEMREAMARFDLLDPRLRAIIREHGLAPVNAAWNLGLRGERLIRGALEFARDMTGRV